MSQAQTLGEESYLISLVDSAHQRIWPRNVFHKSIFDVSVNTYSFYGCYNVKGSETNTNQSSVIPVGLTSFTRDKHLGELQINDTIADILNSDCPKEMICWVIYSIWAIT